MAHRPYGGFFSMEQNVTFESFGLSPALLGALEKQGYREPTAIQTAAIPPVLAGQDVLASAPTGTGKTAAFMLPLLDRLFPQAAPTQRRGQRPRALILTPTRELAAQVHASARQCGKNLPLRSTTIFGGVSMHGQLQALQQGVDLLVATPGRLIDHLQRGSVKLDQIETLVLDEADRMLDMGFLPPLRKILQALPKQRQTLLFSATFAPAVTELALQFLRQPVTVDVRPPNRVADMVSHRVHPVDHERKRELLLHILAEDSRRQTLVFSRTKHGADKLARKLEKAGLRAAAIHGNKSQNQRTRALRRFKEHQVTVLVATDIAARGLDIEQLPLVINVDLPMVAADYVHRVGRTGRAGSPGLAVSLVSQKEAALLRDIQRLLKEPVEVVSVPGFEPAQPLQLQAPARSGGPGSKAGKSRGRRRQHHANAGTGKASGNNQARAGAARRRRRRKPQQQRQRQGS